MNTIVNETKGSNDVKEQFRGFFGISLGIFLFILFFQPFGPVRPQIDEKLLFTAGFGGITFIILWLFRILFQRLVPEISFLKKWNISIYMISYLFIIVFNTVAFVFYLRYVGPLRMTMYLVFKITLINLAPAIILRISDDSQSLKHMLKALLEKNKNLTIILADTETKNKAAEVFSSENKSEIIKLQIDDLILVKSADNYVEIFYRSQEKTEQKLIRGTLKNIENQLKKYSEFIRCHRTYIINKKFVLNFAHNYSGYSLKLSGYEEEIPVSRQYLIVVKEAITSI